MSPGLRQGLVAKSASTIWLLDDDPSVLKATGRLLASADWEVETFIDPDAFLRHAEIHHPRVVVIDMGMPRMDGLEVQRRLSGISPSTRVIVLTANDDRIVRWKAVGSGSGKFFHQASVWRRVSCRRSISLCHELRHRCAGRPTKSDFSDARPFGRLGYGKPNAVSNVTGVFKGKHTIFELTPE